MLYFCSILYQNQQKLPTTKRYRSIRFQWCHGLDCSQEYHRTLVSVQRNQHAHS